jgi:hypothetical protein
MNKLLSFCLVPFYTISTSKDSIQKFTYDNYMRMKAANNPAYAARLLATKLVWELIFGNLENYDADLVMRQDLTVQLNTKMKEFIDKSLGLEPLVEYKFKKTSGTYQLFYPHGRSEYSKLNQENILFLMQRMINGTHTYASDLGATMEAEFTQIRDDYKEINDLQKEKKGEVSEAIPDFETKVKALYDELYLNMLVILAENYKNPTAMLYFFDETIVNYVTHIKTIKIQPQSNKAFELDFSADDIIVVTSKFSKTLKFFFAPTADSEMKSPPNELAGKLRQKVKGTDAGAPDNKFIIFINDTDLDATVTVLVKKK